MPRRAARSTRRTCWWNTRRSERHRVRPPDPSSDRVWLKAPTQPAGPEACALPAGALLPPAARRGFGAATRQAAFASSLRRLRNAPVTQAPQPHACPRDGAATGARRRFIPARSPRRENDASPAPKHQPATPKACHFQSAHLWCDGAGRRWRGGCTQPRFRARPSTRAAQDLDTDQSPRRRRPAAPRPLPSRTRRA